MMEQIEIQDLYYTYPDGTEALQGINLRVKKGEKVAIMGANGSGKSTFFLTLNGVLKPKKGRVFLEGQPLDYSKKGLLSVRRKVGIVFQDPDNQLFSADVTQEISFGVLNLGFSGQEAGQKVKAIMERLNIVDLAEKPTHFLSGGQKKLVALADVLVMEPEIMILDEPTSALDPKHKHLIDGIVEELSKDGITVLLSTHSTERALAWADRIILLHQGKVLREGTPLEIFGDEAALAATNLEHPQVLELYDCLRKQGILPQTAEVPRTMGQLKNLINNSKEIMIEGDVHE